MRRFEERTRRLSASHYPPGFVSSIDVTPEMHTAPPAATPAGDVQVEIALNLRELVQINREMLQISREQLQFSRRAEERHQQQIRAQREEFQRWIEDHPQLEGRCKQARETLRTLLGQSMSELVDFVDENNENLLESDFSRTDLVDRYGSLLHHVSSMYGILKRLAAADSPDADPSSTPGTA